MINIQSLLKLKYPLVLASQSPRRSLLLRNLGFEFEVITSEKEDKLDELDLPAMDYAIHLALLKAEHVAEQIHSDAIVLGADTIVVLGDEILNKPKDSADAYAMLSKLSGNTHIVYTAIALVSSLNKRVLTDIQRTEVTFRELSDEEINAYIGTGSPMDKAGAYGIQDDFGAVFVSNISGCYYNIVGLPLELLYSSLIKFNNIL
jgi:septum formation protein